MLDMLLAHCKHHVLHKGNTGGDEVWQLWLCNVAGQILSGRSYQAM